MSAIIAAANPARELLSSVIRKARRRVSKRDLLITVEEYGDYLKVMECDKNLIADAIKEFPRKELLEGLDELYSWYWKMDCIAGQAA